MPWELQSWNAALKGTSGCSLLHFDTSCLITSGLWMPAYRRPSTESTVSPDSVGYNIIIFIFLQFVTIFASTQQFKMLGQKVPKNAALLDFKMYHCFH